MTFAEFARLQQERKGRQLVIPAVKEYLLGQWGKSERDILHVHPSEMAKKDWCERATYWRISRNTNAPSEEKFNFVLQTIFDEGHQIHDKWQTWLKHAGRLWGDWSCLVHGCERFGCLVPDDDASFGRHIWKYEEVGLEHGLVTGHEDGAVADRLVEFKSVGIGTLRVDAPDTLAKFYKQTTEGKKLYDLDGLWDALKQPLKSHVRQANVYMWLAQMMGGEYARFKSCSIVYEFKPNQQSREYVIPYSNEVVDPLLARVNAIEVGLAADIPPLCPYGGCKKCKAYEDDETAAQGVRDKPRFIWRSASQGAQPGAADPA